MNHLCFIKIALLLALVPLKGEEKTIEFADLPPTLFSAALEIPKVAAVAVSFPEDYDPAKTYPVLLFLGGSQGDTGHSAKKGRTIVGDAPVICMSLPLFLEHLEPMKEDESNKWIRLYIDGKQGAYIWRQYEPMLEAAFALIPNHDPQRAYLGGFSNGANTTVALLNHEASREGLLRYFQHFILIEGGRELTVESAPLANYYIAWGGQHTGKMEDWLQPLTESLSEHGANVVYHEMEGVAHGFPEEEKQKLADYILSTPE